MPKNVIHIHLAADCKGLIIKFQQITVPFIFMHVLEKGEYMAFGLSGQETSSSMINADVAVTYLDGNKPMAVDYYLTQYAQVRNYRGHSVQKS